jgi:hypothetical protein
VERINKKSERIKKQKRGTKKQPRIGKTGWQKKRVMIKNSPGKRSRGSWLGPNNPVLGYRCSGSFSPRVRSLCLRRLGYAAAAVLRLVPRSSLDPSPATSVRQVPGFPARTISLPFLMCETEHPKP